MPLRRKPKRQQFENQLDNFFEKLFDPKHLADTNNELDPKFDTPHELAFFRLLKSATQNPNIDMHNAAGGGGGFSFGDDDPEYDMSDPDYTASDDLSGSDVSSYSKLYESWQSTNEEVIIGDDDGDVDDDEMVSINDKRSANTVAAAAAAATTTAAAAATTNSNSNSNNNAANAANSANSGNNSNSNNNNNTKKVDTATANKRKKSQSKKEANARSFCELDKFFLEQNEIRQAHQQQLKEEQKWNLVKSKKIPTLFLPRIERIQPLLDHLNGIEGVANNFTVKCIQNGAIRLHCKDMETYNIVANELMNNNNNNNNSNDNNNKYEMHTHQLRKDRGYRVVIRHLHSTTDSNWIRDQLIALNFQPRYIRVIKHRFSGKPMNLFEVELQPTLDGTNERILKLERMGSQDVVVEKQLKRIDPVQCHRCQAFGHTKNYCRRQFVCLKCADKHATTVCTKARDTPARCANCQGAHIASYKGCRVFKEEQAKLSTNKARAEMANILQNGLSFGKILSGNGPPKRQRQSTQQQQQQQQQPYTPKQQKHKHDKQQQHKQHQQLNQHQQQQQHKQQHQHQQQQQKQSAKKQHKQQQQHQHQHQQQSAKKQQQHQHQHQQQQQHSAKKQQQKQQPYTPIKGNNSNSNNNNNSKSKQPTYSQIAKSGNSSKAASGPASRHLSAFQEKLQAEQMEKTMQQQQAQQLQKQQSDESLSMALQLNTETIALMGTKMDAMLEIIKVLLSKLLINSSSTDHLQSQQRPLHLEPIVEIAPPNPNDMSVNTTPDITIDPANDMMQYE